MWTADGGPDNGTCKDTAIHYTDTEVDSLSRTKKVKINEPVRIVGQ